MRPRHFVFVALLALCGSTARTDETTVPGDGPPASRYEMLWARSPFAVATADVAPESAEYSLVGIARFDGVSYASLIEKQNQEHFLVSSDKPNKGLALVSVTSGRDPADILAVLRKNGELLTLKLEPAAKTPAAANTVSNLPPSNADSPSLPQPVAPGAAAANPALMPPPVTMRPRIIQIPPPSNFQPQLPSGSPPGTSPATSR